MSAIHDAPAPEAVVLRDLTLGYDRHPAVHHISGTVAPGALLAVVGPNGAGKSTLLKGITGELKPLGGSVAMPRAMRRCLAYLPQRDAIDLTWPISVADIVSMGLWRRRGAFGGIGRGDLAAVEAALAAVGLSGFERRVVGTLSGGQLQRALFARVMVQDAPLILLDEPLAAVDAATAGDLVAVIRRWHGEGRTVVAVLHDLALVRQVFPTSLLMARRLVAWGPTAEVLTPERLAEARGMREAFDDDAPLCEPDAHAHAHGDGHHHDHDHAHGHDHAHAHASTAGR